MEKLEDGQNINCYFLLKSSSMVMAAPSFLDSSSIFFYMTVLQISSAFASYPDMIFEDHLKEANYLVCFKER